MPYITLTTGAALGEEVSASHFGVNATFNFQRYSDFVNASSGLSLTNTRYPGGSETELYFDFTQPNRDFIVHALGNQTNGAGQVGFNLIPMDQFLVHCVANAIQPTIVVPMTQLIGADRGFDAAQTQALRDFITSVLEQMGPIGVAAFELGNEYQAQHDNNPEAPHFNTSAEYGDVSSAAALIIQETIDAYIAANGYDNAFAEPRIEVQIWGYATNPEIDLVARNSVVLSEYNADELAAIDGVVSHYYYNSDLYGLDGIGGAISDITTMMALWQDSTNQDLTYAITEWNVNFRTDGYTGMRQVAPILELFTEFTTSGIDTMEFWSMQYQNTSLASPGNHLTLIGEFMELLEETTDGMVVLDIGTALADYAVHAFSDGVRAVLFISALTGGAGQDIVLDFGALFPQIDGVTATVLGYGGANIDGVYRPNASENVGRVWHAYDEPDADLTSTDYAISGYMDGDISFQLGSYEVMMLEFDLSSLSATTGTNAADTLIGSHYSETINGLDQDDTIHGDGGDDNLNGGNGEDRLWGDQGDDTINGDNDKDTLKGGSGNDSLFGGAGIDKLDGGTGDDFLNGGDNSDKLFGKNGNDVLKGAAGHDLLLGGAGNDVLRGGYGNDVLKGQDGNDDLKGQAGADTLNGGNGSDILRGGDGTDILIGGAGADRFVFDLNDDTNTIMDFEDGLDVVEIIGGAGFSYSDLNISQSSGAVHIQYHSTVIVLEDTNFAEIDIDDFIFS